MAVKKKTAEKVSPAAKVAEKKETKKVASQEKYFYAVGKRKASVAQVKLYPGDKSAGKITINGKDLNEYVNVARLQVSVKSPLVATGQEANFNIVAKVVGGGITGQAEAIRLGITKALVLFDETFRKSLKDLGFLTRDSRVVERKKAGLKKARRAPQWAKR